MLAHQKNNLRIDLSLHSDILSWFQASNLLLLLINAAWLEEKQPSTAINERMATITPTDVICVKKNHKVKKRKQKRPKN